MFALGHHPAEVISTRSRDSITAARRYETKRPERFDVDKLSSVLDGPPQTRKHISFVSTFHGGVDIRLANIRTVQEESFCQSFIQMPFHRGSSPKITNAPWGKLDQ